MTNCIQSFEMRFNRLLRRSFVSINARIFNVVSWANASSPKSEARPINLVAQTLLNRTIFAATRRNPIKLIGTIRDGQLDKSLMNRCDRHCSSFTIRPIILNVNLPNYWKKIMLKIRRLYTIIYFSLIINLKYVL